MYVMYPRPPDDHLRQQTRLPYQTLLDSEAARPACERLHLSFGYYGEMSVCYRYFGVYASDEEGGGKGG